MPSSSRGTPIRTPPGGGPGPGSEEFSDSPSSKQQTSGRADWHRQVAANDRKMSSAYQAGRSGMPADPDYSSDEAAAHSSGAEEAAQPAASPPTGGRSAPAASGSSPLPLGNLPNQVAGAAGGQAKKISAQGAPLLLGMVGYCLAVNWFRYGWPGVTGWFTAKFENKVTLGVTPPNGGLPSNQTVDPKTGQVTQHNPNSANGAANQPLGTLS